MFKGGKGAHEVVVFQDIVDVVKTYVTNPEDLDLINRAYEFIMIKHADQKRRSGEPYTNHLLWVAYILATLQTGPKTIAAGLLHDVMEDCDVPRPEMVERFGDEVTTLVEGVTKINKMDFKDEDEVYAENHRKIYIAMASDIRVILIKFADRLHNMRTLQFMKPQKQKKIARETLEVYTPIAHRLGLSDIKTELENLSLSYLDPIAYNDIVLLLKEKEEQRKGYIDKMIHDVSDLLDAHKISYRIVGRPKSIYSIYKKMFIKNKRFDEIYDLYALRIITDNKQSCYTILGLMHEHYRPIPGRFKDYIAMPKPNMYQSLHTSIIGDDGHTYEIQIRTELMDELAELGVAAHWRYKENRGYSSQKEQQEIGEKLQWLRDFITLSDDIKDRDAKEFYDSLKRDIFEANVYVLSPQGKIIELPNGSTPIDFAYRIHSEVGNTCVGAVVNNVMVPINTKLKTGDVVEIKTSKNATPNRDWLKFVRTTGARNKIRQYITKVEAQSRKEMVEAGRKIFKDEVRKRKLDETKYLNEETYKTYLGAFGAKSFEDILFFIGKKTLLPMSVIDKINPKRGGLIDNISKMLQRNSNLAANQAKANVSKTGVVVEGIDGIKITLSRCCNPIPGDDIVGFVSKGQGIKVHRASCPNVQNPEIKKRLIPVYWDNAQTFNHKFDVDIEIRGLDRGNLLNEIINVLGQSKISILKINAETQDAEAFIQLKLAVEDNDSLQIAFVNLEKIIGIYDVKRIIH